MPVFTLNTNLPKERIPEGFLLKTAKLIASTLGKPISYVVVHVNPDQMMSWAGSKDPCAVATLQSIGQLGKVANKKHSAVIYPHIEKELGIPGDRMYISYEDAPKETMGYDGKTFDDLL